jgi:hypothetical protein
MVKELGSEISENELKQELSMLSNFVDELEKETNQQKIKSEQVILSF